MNTPGPAPTLVSRVVALVLFIVALPARFSLVATGEPVAPSPGVVDIGLLRVACRVPVRSTA